MSLPKPYYQEEGITIYHGDCRDILPHLEPVDLVLTDPPYGINYVLKNDLRRARWKSKFVNQKISGDDNVFDFFKLLNSNNFVVWGADHIRKFLPSGGTFLTWDKTNGRKTCPLFISAEFAWTNIHVKDNIFRHLWSGFFKTRKGEDRYGEKGKNSPRIHPCQKPLELIRWCLYLFPTARIVLDPFMGSGTTLRAAKDLGRKAIGIEIEENYCKIAVKRLQQEVFNFK